MNFFQSFGETARHAGRQQQEESVFRVCCWWEARFSPFPFGPSSRWWWCVSFFLEPFSQYLLKLVLKVVEWCVSCLFSSFLSPLTCIDIRCVYLVGQKHFFLSLWATVTSGGTYLQNKELPPKIFDEGAWREFVFLSGQQLAFS